MSLEVRDLPAELDPVFVTMIQHGDVFERVANIAEKDNYLFYLTNWVIKQVLQPLDSPKTAESFLLGARTYQTIATSAFPRQPTFAHPPDEWTAVKVVAELGSIEGRTIVDNGIGEIDLITEQAPLLTDLATEIVGRYTDGSVGMRRVALGGVAMMSTTHIQAEKMLAA